jgi:uncharacterized repeat protein (TIGR01451 family)
VAFTAPSLIAPSLYSRFRYTAGAGEATTPTGLAPSGEVEDYVLGSLGNRIFLDNGAGGGLINSGTQEGAEPGVPGVVVELYPAGATPGVDAPIATTVTDANGDYIFGGLEPGDYFVYVPPSEFGPGGPLEGLVSSVGAGLPNDDLDGEVDENGLDDPNPAANGIQTAPITLTTAGEPTSEDGDPNTNLTLDLGFVALDWGDLPEGPYPTTLAANGARHVIDGVTFLGAGVDSESDGQPSISADGDDLAGGPDDEDGIRFLTPMMPGQTAVIEFTAGSAGFLNGFVDFDGDGILDPVSLSSVSPGLVIPGSGNLSDLQVPLAGTYTVTINVPAGPIDSSLYARFRFTAGAGEATTPEGYAPSGEVEDYVLGSLGNRVFLDDGSGGGSAGNGAQDGGEPGVPGVVVELYAAGDTPGVDAPIATTLTDGNGDYIFTGLVDGDYVVFIPASEFGPGEPLEGLLSSAGAGDPNADLDQDVDENGLDDPSPVTNGIPSGSVSLILGAAPTTDDGDPNSNLTVDFGFVQLDWGDLPAGAYPTTIGANGARHVLDGTTFLGAAVDAESDGQPSVGADGDDLAGTPDDEDGITFLTPVLPGQLAVIQIVAGSAGFLNGFIDFDGDGTLDPVDLASVGPGLTLPGSGQLSDLAIPSAGTYTVTINVPPGPVASSLYSRFRYTANPGEATTPSGQAPSGEVEDYVGLSLGGSIWQDDGAGGGGDADGQRGGTEAGIPGVVIELYAAGDTPGIDPPLGTLITDANGDYLFTGLEPGDYFVHVPASEFAPGGPLEDGRSSLGAGDPNTDADDDVDENGIDTNTPEVDGVSTGPINLSPGGEPTAEDGDPNSNLTLDLGFWEIPAVGGALWYDANNNGVQDPGEPPLVGVGVSLVIDNGPPGPSPEDVVLFVDTTDGNGEYLFTNLTIPPDTYYLLVDETDLPGGMVLSVGSTNPDGPFTVGSGDVQLDHDFGYTGTGAIGDTVFLDDNGNGMFDPGEGIEGVLVTLETTLNGVPYTATTTTDANGQYRFPNLPAGSYTISIDPTTLPPGVQPLLDPDGIDTPNSATVELLAGEELMSGDFGYEFSLLAGSSRAKLFYDPADGDDVYVNQRGPNLLPTLRLYGQTAVCDPLDPGRGNIPVTAGANLAVDPRTGLVAEDPAYTDPEGPFSPLSLQSPEADYVTWNPAWISERLGEARLQADWGCANGLDEVSAGANIRAGGRNASEKVWLRTWYEPTHLDKDLNADNCLTDLRGGPDGGPDGIPDAPMNPSPSSIDEWYPAIMTELTYMLVENDPLPQPDASPSQLHRSAPRPACGAPGPSTRIVFPVGTVLTETLSGGPAVGYGLTSLDVDFDGVNDMITVADERTLPAQLGGTTIDFDGDGIVDVLDGDRTPGAGALSCDELAVFHTDAVTIGLGETAQFLDHFVRVSAVTGSGALLEIVYSGDLQPRAFNPILVGNGATALAGDIGPAQLIGPGGSNLGSVPRGPWFVHLVDSDPDDDTAIVILGRGLGAPCASMEDGPNRTNLRPGSPYFLKRFYVDGHEYNVTAIMSCDTGGFQYLSLRAPLPKVPVTIEQHSVRLQPYGPVASLALPPPFNHEHTILEDVAALDDFGTCPVLPGDGQPEPRPEILYMGGPIGPIPPVLGAGDSLPYVGRSPNAPVGPYTDTLASSWFYVLEDHNPGFAGQLREKYGAVNTGDPECPVPPGVPASFFYNEQVLAAPYSFTEFHFPELPDPTDPTSGQVFCDPDSYYVTSNLVDPNARARQWRMPDAGVPANVPPSPPDLIADASGFDATTDYYGVPRRASFEFDPDNPEKLVSSAEGVRLYGGYLPCADADCDGTATRPSILYGAGDTDALSDPLTGAPVEVLPYTDPFAPFNPQHPDAPRTDSLTFNPAFLSEFQHSGEDLASLYSQISNAGQNALQKVYHRMWYQPEYITKLRLEDDCEGDIAFPALMQEYTFLSMDTTVNPLAMPPGSSQLAFPMASRADELPLPGTNPPGGAFGYGLTTFDADFNGSPEAVQIHSEATLNAFFDASWQATRPTVPGFPPPPVPGPVLDFDGDGTGDDGLDEDCRALNGNEMVVFALESVLLDRDAGTPGIGQDVMFLDYMARVTNVTGGSFPRAQFEIRYTGGGPASAVPQPVPGGTISLDVGDAIVVDYFGGGVRRVRPGEDNLGDLDGAWFLFVKDVSSGGDLVVVTVGRALGASHSAIDDGSGNHDLEPGDPWYLKRFYVDGHEYNVVALMTQTPAGADPQDPAECNSDFAFITLRTPVPKGILEGSQYNYQDSLFQQGYFLDDLPAEMSVLPPFNVDHTIAVDVERIDPQIFDDPDGFVECTGPIAPAGPLTQTIRAEEPEPRRAVELRETYSISRTLGTRPAWETQQSIAAASGYTEIGLPEDQTYLLTMAWRSRDNRLSFYGCTPLDGGPFDADNPPPLSQEDLQSVANCWRAGIVPDDEEGLPPYIGPRAGGDYANLPGPGGPAVPPQPLTGSDLRLAKTALTQTPVAGTQFAYLIEVFNDGPDLAASYVVSDTLPAGLSYASDTTGGACSLVSSGPDMLRCDFGNLAVGDSRLFAILAFVDPGVPPGTPMVNTAKVELGQTILSLAGEPGEPGELSENAGEEAPTSGAEVSTASAEILTSASVAREPLRPLAAGDPNPNNNADSTTVFIVAEADLGLSHLATGPDPVVAGEVFTSSFRIGNAGPSDAPALRLILDLPAGTTYAGSQGAACGGLPIGGTGRLTCDRGKLPLGGETEIQIALRVDPSVDPGSLLQSQPSVSAPGASDPQADNDAASGETTSIAEVDLSVEKIGPARVGPGERFEWTINVRNAGPSDARGVSLIEILPAGLRLIDHPGLSCTESPAGTFRCDLGRIAAQGLRSLRLTMEVDPNAAEGSLIGGSTELISATTERDASDNRTTGPELVVRREADLALSLRSPGTVSAGSEQEWQIQVSNAGPTGAAPYSIELSLPTGLAFVGTGNGCLETAAGSGEVVCTLPNLASGWTATRSLRTRADAGLAEGSRLSISAILRPTSLDPNLANNSASAELNIIRRFDLVAGLSEITAPAVAGGRILYTMSVSNRGPSLVEGVSLSSVLPAGSGYRSDDGGCSLAGASLSCAIGSLAPGEAPRRITVELDLDAALADGTVLTLRALAGGPSGETAPADNAAAAELAVGALADLRLDPPVSEMNAIAGSRLVQRYRLSNAGPSLAPEIILSDVIPSGSSLVSVPAGCALESGLLRCALGDLPPGEARELSYELLLDAGLAEGSLLESEASAESAATDPDPASAGASRRILVGTEADLLLRKEGPDAAQPGQPIQYRLTISNAGPSDASGLRLIDRLPAGFDYKIASLDCQEQPDELVCDLGGLAAGEALEVRIEGSVDAGLADGTLLVNEALLESSTADPVPTDNQDQKTTRIELADAADLALALVASEPEPAAGTELSLRALATNAGPRPAPQSRLRLTLPVGLSYVGDAPGCALVSAGILECELGTLAVGALEARDLQLALAADAVEGSLLSVEAELTGQRADPNPANDRARAELLVGRRADLALSLIAEPSGAEPIAGEALRYVATARNLGPSTSEAAELSLLLPTGARFVSDDAGCETGGLPLLVCPLPALDSGGAVEMRIDVQLKADLSQGASLVASGELSSLADPEPANDRATAVVSVGRRADLRLSKSVSHAERAPGEPVAYSLRVENLGPSQARAVLLVDLLPEGLVYLTDDAGCSNVALPELRCALGRIDPGAVREIRVLAKVAEDRAPGPMTNQAELSSQTSDPDLDNNRASAELRVTALVDLALSLEAAGELMERGDPPRFRLVPGAVTAGRNMTYTLEARNAGPATATGTEVTLQLPEGLRWIAGGEGICEEAAEVRTLRCALGELEAGASRDLALVVTVDPDRAAGLIEAVAELNAAEPEALPEDNEARQTTAVSRMVALSVSLSATPAELLPGEVLSLVADYASAGPSTARAAELNFELPAGMDLPDLSELPEGCSLEAEGRLRCILGDLAPGAAGRLTLPLRADDGATGGDFLAAVLLSSETTESEPTDNRAEAAFSIVEAADLSLSLSGLGETWQAGDPPTQVSSAERVTAGMDLVYRLEARNAGPAAASDPLLIVTLPAGLQVLEAPEGCSLSALPELRCTLPSMAAGESRELLLRTRVPADLEPGSPLLARATIQASAVDRSEADNQAEHAVTVEAWADLAMAAELDPSAAQPGAVVSLTLTAANLGPSMARGAGMLISLPGSLSVESAPAGCEALGGSETAWRCALADLAPGGTVSRLLYLRVQDEASGELVLAASAAGGTADRQPANNSANAGILVSPSAPPLEPTPTPEPGQPTPTPEPGQPTPTPEPGQPTPVDPGDPGTTGPSRIYLPRVVLQQ